MSRGRKPTPTRLKLLLGNPGGRPLNALEPRPAAAVPARPPHLAGEAAAEWDRITRELAALGLVTEVDRAALAAYCTCWARWVKAEETISRSGEVLKGENGVYQNPWLAIANRCLELLHKFGAEFGLTPSSRTRVRAPAPARDDLDQFLAG